MQKICFHNRTSEDIVFVKEPEGDEFNLKPESSAFVETILSEAQSQVDVTVHRRTDCLAIGFWSVEAVSLTIDGKRHILE